MGLVGWCLKTRTQYVGHGRSAQRQLRMPAVGLLHSIAGKETKSVNAKLVQDSGKSVAPTAVSSSTLAPSIWSYRHGQTLLQPKADR